MTKVKTKTNQNSNKHKKKRKYTNSEDASIKSSETKDIIKNYSRTIKIDSVADLFKLAKTKALPQEEFEFVTLCKEINSILKNMIVNGYEDPDVSEVQFKNTFTDILYIFRDYRIVKYEDLKKYALLDSSNRWSLATLCFIVECHIILMLHVFHIDIVERLTEKDYERLCELEIIYTTDREVMDFTQNDVIIQMNSIAELWTSVRDLDEVVFRFIDNLYIRIAILCVQNFEEDVMDGRDRVEKVLVKRHDRKYMFTSSSEFKSDMCSMMTYLQNSIKVYKYIHKHTNKGMGPKVVELEYWSSMYHVPTLIAGFRSWISSELIVMQAAKFREKLKNTVFDCSLRLGEKEKYARVKGGIFTDDTLSIVECTRTPLQNYYWNMQLIPTDISSLLPNFKKEYEYEYSYIGSIITALVFRYHCESAMNFPWWMHNFLDARDFFKHLDTIEWRKEPFIIQYAGEFNVYANDKLWLTRDIDVAIIFWCVYMVDKNECKFQTLEKIFNLGELKDMLYKWNMRGKMVIDEMKTKKMYNRFVHPPSENDDEQESSEYDSDDEDDSRDDMSYDSEFSDDLFNDREHEKNIFIEQQENVQNVFQDVVEF